MASKLASAAGTAAIASAAVYIDLPNRRYLLTSVVALTNKRHLTLVSVENARRIVSDAMLCNVGVANAIASRFGTFDGDTCSAKVPVQATPERVANLLARHRLLLIDLGPPVARVDTLVSGPRADAIAELPMSNKVLGVVRAMTELPAEHWQEAFGDAGIEALKSLKEPQTLATLAFVFAIWAFAQTNPAGWVMDAALIGIAVVSLGLGIFGWIGQLEDCLAQVAAIRTPEAEKLAAKALLKVLGRLGIDVLITLLTRAAGKAVKARSSGVKSRNISSDDGGGTSSSFNKKRARPIKNTAVQIDRSQLQHGYKHAKDFGVSGNANNATLSEFEGKIKTHVNSANTGSIRGTYRGQNVMHHLDKDSRLNVIVDADGKFLSGWKLSEKQLEHVLATGKLGGGS